MIMNKRKKWLMFVLECVLVIIIVFFLFRWAILSVKIEGISMENNLHDHSIALMNRLEVNVENIKRFDVVVLESDALHEKIIKRVIGLPKDTVEMKNDILYINGQRIEQNFLDSKFVEDSKKKYSSDYFTNNFKVTLGEDEFFVLGDNRLQSVDSRILGPFHFEDIKASRGLVIYPFSSIEVIE